jgi:adenylate cyclase
MVIGGVPIYAPDHLERLADIALDMAATIERIQADRARPVQVRIGLSCGPIVAGVIGSKRTIYDVWGDTVNVASRMESLSTPGRIHVSDEAYSRLKDRFDFEPRGEIEVKGKGVMATYYLLGRRSA